MYNLFCTVQTGNSWLVVLAKSSKPSAGLCHMGAMRRNTLWFSLGDNPPFCDYSYPSLWWFQTQQCQPVMTIDFAIDYEIMTKTPLPPITFLLFRDGHCYVTLGCTSPLIPSSPSFECVSLLVLVAELAAHAQHILTYSTFQGNF